MGKIAVLIVDDSFFMRRVIGDILRADPDIEIVGEAADGVEALEKIAHLHPNVVTLDIEMPEMNGVETLRHIVARDERPAVVMVSGFAPEGAEITLECLRLGAVDFVAKPSGSFSLDMSKVAEELRRKVEAAAAANLQAKDAAKESASKSPVPHEPHYHKESGVVIIGSSTGGPAALESILPMLPANFPYAVAVAQHLPSEFTDSFLGRLKKTCQLPVERAEDDVPLKPGTLYIVAGGTTTTITERDNRRVFAVVTNTVDIQTPSVDELMASAAAVYGNKTIGVILTGMGSDGLLGMGRIKQAGGATIVQDEASSVVYGMGKEVVEGGLADHIVPLSQVINKVNELLQ